MASNTKNNEIKLEEEILLEEIKTRIIKKLPEEVKLANIEFEGPEVVIYTKNPDIIADNGSAKVKVNQGTSNNGREFYQLQIIE